MDQLDLWIESNEEDLIKDIASLIEIPSVADKNQKVLPYGIECEKALNQMLFLGEKYGFETDNCDGYCGSISFGSGERTIGIWGHLDVVEAGNGWIYPPYFCTRKEDFLIGRGVQDNKGPLIAVLYALKYLKEKKDLKAKVNLIFGCNEENGMDDVVYYLQHRAAPDWSFVADCSFPVCHGEKGICRFYIESDKIHGIIISMNGGVSALNIVPAKGKAVIEEPEGKKEIEVTGISGHAAFPENTVNAIGLLAKELKKIVSDKKEKAAMNFLEQIASDGYGKGMGIACRDEISGELTCNIGNLTFEEGILRFGVDIRYPVTMKSGEIIKKIRESIAPYHWNITEYSDSPPNYIKKDYPLVKSLMDVYVQETGRKDEPYIMGGGTYARKIPNAVGFGPGLPMNIAELELPDGHGACHGADEVQSITNLKKAIRIYAKAIEKLCNYE